MYTLIEKGPVVSRASTATSPQIADPVFIVSSGRSGTTLLRAMLNAGGEIMFPHESDFVARAYPFYGNKRLDIKDYATLVRFFMDSSQNNGWKLPRSHLLKTVSRASPGTLAELIELLHVAYCQYHQFSAARWGNKTPVLIASLERIFAVFPNAQVVHLVRDGRDVFLSYRTVHNAKPSEVFGPAGVVTAALYWVDGLRRVGKCADNVYTLRYEDLLAHPADVLRQLCAHLGLHYSEVMVNDYQNSPWNRAVVLDAHKETIHAKLLGGLDRSNTEKYATQMTRRARFVFEVFTAPYLRKYGYPLEFPFVRHRILAPLRWLCYAAASLYNNLRYSARDRAGYARAKHATEPIA